MPVPERPVKEDGQPPPCECHVWGAWKRAEIHAVAKNARLPHGSPQNDFDRRALVSDGCHPARCALGVMISSHGEHRSGMTWYTSSVAVIHPGDFRQA
jgi:hypothetical protein